MVPITVISVTGMRIVRIVQLKLDRKNSILRRARSCDNLLDRQIASTVVGCVKNILIIVGNLIILTINDVIIRAFCSGRRIRPDQDLGNTLNNHRPVDIRRQIPAITEVLRLDNRVLMAGLLDVAADDLAIRNVEFFCRRLTPRARSSTRHRFAHLDILIRGIVLCQRNGDVRCISIIDSIDPILDNRNGGRRQIHGFRGRIIDFLIRIPLKIREVGIQVGIRLQRIAGFLAAVDGVLLFFRQIIKVLQAVVQVGDQVISLLAGPHGELQGIDPAILQLARFAKIPGDTVAVAVAGAGSSLVIFTRSARDPFSLRFACRGDVVLKAAGLARGDVGGDVGQGGGTVIHGDAAGTQVVHDRLRDTLESSFDCRRRSTVNEITTITVCVGDQVAKITQTVIGGVSAVNTIEFTFRSKQVCPVGSPAIGRCIVVGAGSACPSAGSVVVCRIAVRIAVGHEHHVRGILLQIIAVGNFICNDIIGTAKSSLPASTHVIGVVRQAICISLHCRLRCSPVYAPFGR